MSGVSRAQTQTTFILVRHAEKENDGTRDPELSSAGKERAIKLAELFAKANINGIYSTPYKRTRSTAVPLAKAKSLDIQDYEGKKLEDIDQMLKAHKGGIVLVVGHSNTIPTIANYLTGENSFKDFADSEYGNLLLVTLTEIGKAKVTWLTY